MERRTLSFSPEKFCTRAEDGNLYIEGYFAVFGSTYELWEGAIETIAPGAFDGALAGDIRALINHDTTLVLGRTIAGTLTLRVDERGLWGSILINQNDQDAMNLYYRVQRGDVDQCSFGFDILNEETDFRDDGSIHWTLQDVELYEVSPCTFPAYESTQIQAREAQRDDLRARKLQAWKEQQKARIK